MQVVEASVEQLESVFVRSPSEVTKGQCLQMTILYFKVVTHKYSPYEVQWNVFTCVANWIRKPEVTGGATGWTETHGVYRKQRRHRVRTWAGSFFSHSQTIKLWINVGCFLVSSDVHSNTRRNVHLSSATARWGSLNLHWPCHVTLRGLDSPRLTVKQSFLTSPELWTSDGWGEETERLWIWFSTRTLLKLETESIKSGVRQEVMLPLSIYST